jgi:hypothetical protein
METAGWSIRQDEECITLTPADVESALQISTYVRRTGGVHLSELLKIARVDPAPYAVAPAPVQCGAFSGFSCEYAHDRVFWRRWYLGRDSTHLFVAYNTELESRERHRAVVDWMLSTLNEA